MKDRKFYITRKKGGKEQTYSDAEKLLSKAFEYFAWCEDNPLYKKELMRSGDRKGDIVEVPVSRPYTLAGLCVYCGIAQDTFNSYAENELLRDATTHIIDIIRQNQLEGAISGTYNASFVLRLLDLENKHEFSLADEQPYIINVAALHAKDEIEYLRKKVGE